jgi:hypothetical protein
MFILGGWAALVRQSGLFGMFELKLTDLRTVTKIREVTLIV